MRTKIFTLVLVLFGLVSTPAFSQYNPYSDGSGLVTVGVGFSGWGIPIFARYEHPVADNITVGGTISFQTKSENWSSYKWRHTITGLNARGSYHFNELLNAPDEWDFYGGASLGYFIWNTKYDGPGTYDYAGSGSGGFSLGVHVGARYFVSDKIAVGIEGGGGTVLAGGTLGVTFIL